MYGKCIIMYKLTSFIASCCSSTGWFQIRITSTSYTMKLNKNKVSFDYIELAYFKFS